MWGASSKGCELNCQCSGLITDNFKINSGNNSTKRKREESLSYNYKTRMNPHTIDFNKSPGSPNLPTSKRRILGEIQLSTPPFDRMPSPVQRMSPFQRIKTPTQASPFQWKSSPTHTLLLSERRTSPTQIVSPVERRKSPVLTKKSEKTMVSSLSTSRKQCKLSRVFEDRTQFKLANKENENVSILSETFMEFDMGEEARDCSFSERFGVTKNTTNWTNNLDFTDAIAKPEDLYVPEKELTEDEDITLMDLDHEFDSDNFDQCTNYEIVSTDSPNIISQGRATSRKVTARNFMFGAPLAENETSTSFNRPNTATRMLNFDEEEFEFTSPPVKCVKKSLQFEQPKLRHNTSNSSIGSMSGSSMTPNKTRLSYISESTVSVESGFVSEFEEPSLDNDETNSPKMENICELISGKIKNNLIGDKVRWPLSRSLSCNPGKAKVSLLSILESPVKRNIEDDIENINTKRRKSNRNVEVVSKPVLQRALSENNASIMSALARSVEDPDLIGDFTRTFSLPLTVGEHADLKSICCDTLARLVRGEYKDVISDYKVIDCRYPYEYEGGHIAGAINCYSPTLVSALLHHHKPLHSPERTVLVFHCEFSKERGPKLSRYLRSSDREKNKDNYPNLHYPEIYLLHEGYRSFYRRYPELCSPCGYIAMLDPTYKSQLRVHRNVSQPPSTTQSHKRNRLLF